MSHEKVFHKQVPAILDITGQRFGLLTAVSYVGNNNSFWLFRCDCGNAVTRTRHKVRTARFPQSCGCAKHPRNLIDIAGNRYGHLTAISYVKHTKSQWLFRCDCGKTIARGRHVVNRAVATYRSPPHCGCIRPPLRRKHWATNTWWYCRRTSAHRGFPFDMTVEQVGELISRSCHYCGGAPSTRHRTGLRNGIDRVDSSLGYAESNCVPCCSKCNQMKSDHSVTDFLSHISAIHHHSLCVPNIIHIKHHAPPLTSPHCLVHADSVAHLRAAAAGSRF